MQLATELTFDTYLCGQVGIAAASLLLAKLLSLHHTDCLAKA